MRSAKGAEPGVQQKVTNCKLIRCEKGCEAGELTTAQRPGSREGAQSDSRSSLAFQWMSRDVRLVQPL